MLDFIKELIFQFCHQNLIEQLAYIIYFQRSSETFKIIFAFILEIRIQMQFVRNTKKLKKGTFSPVWLLVACCCWWLWCWWLLLLLLVRRGTMMIRMMTIFYDEDEELRCTPKNQCCVVDHLHNGRVIPIRSLDPSHRNYYCLSVALPSLGSLSLCHSACTGCCCSILLCREQKDWQLPLVALFLSCSRFVLHFMANGLGYYSTPTSQAKHADRPAEPCSLVAVRFS